MGEGRGRGMSRMSVQVDPRSLPGRLGWRTKPYNPIGSKRAAATACCRSPPPPPTSTSPAMATMPSVQDTHDCSCLVAASAAAASASAASAAAATVVGAAVYCSCFSSCGLLLLLLLLLLLQPCRWLRPASSTVAEAVWVVAALY